MSVESKIIEAFESQFGIEGVTSRKDVLRDHCDSIDLQELAMYVEEEFDIMIVDSDLEDMVTVGDLVDYVIEQGAEDV